MAAPTKRRSRCWRRSARVERIPEYIKRAKDKNDRFRLMGFGHRVYKNYDPRAKIMQKTCHEVLNELGIKDDPLLEVAMELERIALHDEYFIEKKLYPNIDFYSGITLKAMGFPTTMFTVLFAVARTVGWIAQWKEMIEDPHQKIGRPRQLYTGAHAARLSADLAPQVGLAPDTGQTESGRNSVAPTWRAAQAGFAQASTISAARRLGDALPISMIASSRANASIWRRRSGLSVSNGASASAKLLRRAVPLQELRHDVFARDQIGQDDRRHLDRRCARSSLRTATTL